LTGFLLPLTGLLTFPALAGAFEGLLEGFLPGIFALF
jgi:hypothetical protein